MTAEETIKLDNFKAHYGVILNNITVANTNLSALLLQEDAAKVRIEKLFGVEQDASTRVLALTQREEQLKSEWASKENSLNLRDEKLKKDESSLLAQQEAFKQSLVDERKKFDDSLLDVKTQIINEEAALVKIKGLVKVEQDKLVLLQKDIKDITETIASSRLLLDKIKNELEVFASESNTTKINLNAEIKELTEKRDALMKTLETPTKILEEREAAVTLRERDVQVWVRRIQKKFKLLYPQGKLDL